MLKRLEESHFYDVDVNRHAGLDRELQRVSTMSAAMKRATVLRFFEKNPKHVLTEQALRKLHKIVDDSMTIVKKNNFDAHYGLWTHDLLYVFVSQKPNRRSIDALMLYLEDHHAQKNGRVLYNLLAKQFTATTDNDEIIAFSDEDESDFEFDSSSDIELSE